MTDPFQHAEISAALAHARRALPDLVERLATHVRLDVRAFDGPPPGRRHRLITMALTAAVTYFLDVVERPATSSRGVDDVFRRLGRGEALAGDGDVHSLQFAIHTVTREAWGELRTYASENRWSADMVVSLYDAVVAVGKRLAGQVDIGFEEGRREAERDPGRSRDRLVKDLLDGAALVDIPSHLIAAVRRMPPKVVVVAVSPIADLPLPDLTDLVDRHLVRADPMSAVLLVGPDECASILDDLSRRTGSFRIALSWPVERTAVPDAWRWARNALMLADQGVIEPAPIIDCKEHREQIWLQSEPLIRQHLCQELLGPLLAETSHSRAILSETLLAWLESHESAPAIAGRLGVHPQTVRYRWKRINELFGDSLRDPDFVAQAAMLLKASVPLWKAGDRSDMERFHDDDPA